jgi:hypothetical protein
MSDIDLPEGWSGVEPEQAAGLGRELRRELSRGHALYGVAASAIAVRYENDDALFVLTGSPHPYAVVHLTWHRENDPQWPAFRFFETLDEVAAAYEEAAAAELREDEEKS